MVWHISGCFCGMLPERFNGGKDLPWVKSPGVIKGKMGTAVRVPTLLKS